MERLSCSICDSKLQHIYSLNEFPIKLCCLDQPKYDNNELSFSQCQNCKTIQLDKLIPLDILYSDSHNTTSVGDIWKKYFILFSEKIQPIINNKIVLEIGCPSGKIVSLVKNFNKWIIVEPNKKSDIIFDKNVIFIQHFFDNNFKLEYKVNLIIHSHLFEHIYNFNEFLSKCYDILCDDGEMFFGVPNMQHIAESEICPFLGIFFEHTCFLNKENISILLNNNNFEIMEIIDYENHSTLYHVKKTSILSNKIQPIFDYKNMFFNSINNYSNLIKNINDYIINSKKDVYIFGCSYNTQFLISLGLELTKIKGILDNCKEKQGKYLYGYNVKIYEPTILTNQNCIVIIKNGYYTNEIIKQIYEINKYTEILS